jgi:serine/threonine-protein kinase RsbW
MKEHILELNSSLSELNKLTAFVEQISDEHNINNSYFGNILISLNEAVENAIIHANKQDFDKKVTVHFLHNEVALEFRVIDEGNGFDFDNIPDPTDINNNEKEGRGVFLIRKLADNSAYDKEKRCMLISFKTSSINKELASKRVGLLKKFEKETINNKVQEN